MSSENSNFKVEYVGSLFGHNGWVTSLAVGSDGDKPLLVSGSRDRTLIVWKLDLENPVEFVAGEETVGDKETREVKDYKVGTAYRSLKGHSHFVSCLAMSKDSKYVVSGSWGKNYI